MTADPVSDESSTARAQPRSPWKDRFAAVGFRCISLLFRWLPAPVVYPVADGLGRLLAWRTRRRERRRTEHGQAKARRGITYVHRIVLRERWTSAATDALIGAYARHVAHLFVDFCRMPRVRAANLETVVDTSELEQVRAVWGRGAGIVCATGHIGHWELLGHAAAVAGLPVVSIHRPLDNPHLETQVGRIRRSGGMRLVSKWGALWPVRKALGNGDVVGIVADENDPTGSTFVPFLGTPAATHPAPALLGLRATAPIVVATCQRERAGRYRIRVWDLIEVGRGSGTARDVREVTARINAALSRAISEYPEQWLWGSRRYETRPDGERFDSEGLPPRCEEVGLALRS